MAVKGIREHWITGPGRESVAYLPKASVERAVSRMSRRLSEAEGRIAELEAQVRELLEENGLLRRRKYALECRIDADDKERRELHGKEAEEERKTPV